MGGGLIEILAINWIPLSKNHLNVVLTQIGVGLTFIPIYYFVFKTCIEKFKLKTPGREDDDEEVKLYTKKDYRDKKETGAQGNSYGTQALEFLKAFGGANNIDVLNNCATRLRVSVKDESAVAHDSVFKSRSPRSCKKR